MSHPPIIVERWHSTSSTSRLSLSHTLAERIVLDRNPRRNLGAIVN